MSAHTHCPWVVIKSASGKPLVIADHPQHEGDIAKCQDTVTGNANARLIAAAPDLLAALEEVKAVLIHQRRFGTDTYGAWRNACVCTEGYVEDVIAKATGSAS